MPARRNDRYSVDARVSDNPDAPLDCHGRVPPFLIFDADMQDWLPRVFRNRWHAALICYVLNLMEHWTVRLTYEYGEHTQDRE